MRRCASELGGSPRTAPHALSTPPIPILLGTHSVVSVRSCVRGQTCLLFPLYAFFFLIPGTLASGTLLYQKSENADPFELIVSRRPYRGTDICHPRAIQAPAT